jgi:hypothetical protein
VASQAHFNALEHKESGVVDEHVNAAAPLGFDGRGDLHAAL